MTSTLRLATWNVNGLRSYILDSLASSRFRGKTEIAAGSNLAELLEKTQANILCFQETRCNLDTMARFQIPNWRIWSNSSSGDGPRSGNRYSGTSIWVTEAFLEAHGEPQVLRIIPGLAQTETQTEAQTETKPEEAVDPEGRFLGLDFGRFLVMNSYVPNSGSNAAYRSGTWDVAVRRYLECLKADRPDTIVVWAADWNVAPTPRDLFIGDPVRTAKGQRIVKRHRDLGHTAGHPEYTAEMEAWRTEWEATDEMQGVGDRVQAGFLAVERQAWCGFLQAGYLDAWRLLHPSEDYTGYTWFSLRAKGTRPARLGWRIDHVLVSEAHGGRILKCQNLPEVGEATRRDEKVGKYGSDHVPLFVEVDLKE